MVYRVVKGLSDKGEHRSTHDVKGEDRFTLSKKTSILANHIKLPLENDWISETYGFNSAAYKLRNTKTSEIFYSKIFTFYYYFFNGRKVILIVKDMFMLCKWFEGVNVNEDASLVSESARGFIVYWLRYQFQSQSSFNWILLVHLHYDLGQVT